jgi:uncharacterized protein with HEPN domain
MRTKRAAERNSEIIGEAMNRILKENSAIEISNSRKIAAVRNRIIHEYDSVSDDLVWGISINQLPILKVEVENYLRKSNFDNGRTKKRLQSEIPLLYR